MYLSYFGIRVRDFEKSLRFYTDLFGLKLIKQGDNTPNGGGKYALLRDSQSGQKLELNWYPPGSQYNVTYEPGEGLDHIAFRVTSVSETVKELASKGVEFVNIPESIANPYLNPAYTYHLAYLKDPDGNWLELYDSSEPMGSGIPEGY